MPPSTPSRTRKASSKKRTRQDITEDDNNDNGQQNQVENDLDMKSPAPKKRNTAKTPSRSRPAAVKTATTATPQNETPLSTRKSRRSRASQPPPPVQEEEEIDEDEVQVISSDSINGSGSGIFSSFQSSVNRFVATVQDKATAMKSTSVSATAPPQETQQQEVVEQDIDEQANDDVGNGGILSKLQSSMNRVSMTIKDTAAKLPSVSTYLKQQQDKEVNEHPDKDEVDGATSTTTTIRYSNASFYHGRKFLWYCLLSCSFLALVLGILWASVVTYDVTDLTLEINQCQRALKIANGKLATTDQGSAKDKFYLDELEKKAQHWKKQAKQSEALAQGYKQEYQAILKQLEGE